MIRSDKTNCRLIKSPDKFGLKKSEYKTGLSQTTDFSLIRIIF